MVPNLIKIVKLCFVKWKKKHTILHLKNKSQEQKNHIPTKNENYLKRASQSYQPRDGIDWK